ncbi:hypothetical protein [Streptomyces prunicolor]|uniref:ABC transporter permease n=1 Tax=Streptomyces prunicolor TaxID=67348 RepID=A0ABU4FSN6_9ACTN|nr:hypothetical protein [Streptomyces prunicolor]MDV7223623.1 hypothetical protein [Streptomyces prunicolor]
MTALALSPTTQPQRAVLRLHRPALTVWGAFLLLAVGALLWVHLFRAPAERHPVDQYFVLTDVNNVMNFLGEVLSYVSLAVAAWAGAALVGRELETGTARLAWAQSVTPARWLTAQLGAAALPLTAGTTLLGLVYAWVWTGDQDVLVTNWSYDRVLVPAGPLSVALVLFALAAGTLAGVALGRALPALGVAAGVTFAARYFFGRTWDNIWPDRHFWPVQLTATAVLLALTALALVAAYTLLGRRTNSKGTAV